MRQTLCKAATTVLLVITLAAVAQAQDVVVSQTFTVAPGKYAYFSFVVPPAGASVTGRFRAQGGGGNDIEAFIVDQDGFENYSNGHRVRTFFNSGRATVGTISATLGAGRYYIIFNNGFSVFSNKVVEAHVVAESLYTPRAGGFSGPRESPRPITVASSMTRLLNVRGAPSSRAPVIGQLRKYEKIYVRQVRGRWTEIEWNGGSGFVLSRYVGF